MNVFGFFNILLNIIFFHLQISIEQISGFIKAEGFVRNRE